MADDLANEQAVLAQIGRLAVRYVEADNEYARRFDDPIGTVDGGLGAQRDSAFGDLRKFIDRLPRKIVQRLVRPK